jgi:hypothetical protein
MVGDGYDVLFAELVENIATAADIGVGFEIRRTQWI